MKITVALETSDYSNGWYRATLVDDGIKCCGVARGKANAVKAALRKYRNAVKCRERCGYCGGN